MRTQIFGRAATVTLLATIALGGCGGSSGQASEKAVLLTQEQIAAALLTVADVGADFRAKEKDGTNDTDLGCLNAMDSIKDGFPGAQESVDIAIEATPEPNVPEVGNQINVFASEAAAIDSLEGLVSSLADCTSVEKDNDGVQIRLSIRTDDTTSTPDVDQQFNLDFTGVFAGDGIQLPVSQRGRFMRIGNVITGTYFSSFETSTSDRADELAEFVLAKIVPLIQGGEIGQPGPLNLAPFTG